MSKTKIANNLRVRAAFSPDTLNEEQRTVDVVFGTDTPVRMYTWDGPVWEILSFERKHVKMDRLERGAPLLDNHSRWGSVDDTVVGVVENARVDGKQGYATVRFSNDEKGKRLLEKVKDGILRNISVGYTVSKYERTKAEKPGEMDTLRAIDWTPYEISLVSVPADANAQVRSEAGQDQFSEVETIIHSQTKIRTMDENTPATPATPTPAPAPAPAAPAVDAEQVRAAAVKAERERVQGINAAVRAAKLSAEFGQRLIDEGTSLDNARAAIIDEWAKQETPAPTRSQNPAPTARVTADHETDNRREAITDALFLRADPILAAKQVSDERKRQAQQYRGLSLLDIARQSLERSGVNTSGMDKMELVKRAITSSSSDFPVLLEGTNRRVLLAAYESMGDMWRRFCTVGSVGDFREYKRLRTGSFGNLDKIQENGEYKNKPIPDGESEKIYAETKGNTINVTRKMIVNDDLSAFTRLASMLGRAAARSIESDVFALFALNSGNGPVMGDGKTLFHADHGNIAATAAAPSVTSFDAARVQMALQKDPSGNDFLDLRPALWLGPIALGGNARVVNDNQYDPDVTNKFQVANKVRGLVGDIIDTPRLSGTAWYMLANPSDEPVFEVAFLDGVQTPYLEQQETFDVDGIRWKIRLDYGVGGIGWRGIVKNAGQ